MAFSGSNYSSIPMLLSITTRGIGLNLCSFYAQYERSLRRNNLPLPDINAVYRAMLAIVETKLMNVGLAPRNFEHVYDYDHRLRPLINERAVFWIPVTLQRILDAIGEVKSNEGYDDEGDYFPVMSKNTEIDGKFVPRPENILLSNLRETVVALADLNDSEAAVLHRESFYQNNPIPAAQWDDNHTLLNADIIMPAEYDYGSHLQQDLDALESLSRCCRFLKLHKVSVEKARGDITSLMGSQMSGLRTPDLRSEETLTDYYRNAEPNNDIISSFYSLVNLNEDEKMRGATMLLGEQPAIDNCPHHSAKLTDVFHTHLVLLEESKLSIAQRQKSALKLRENDERKADSELLVQMPLVRPRTSRRRSLSTIRESGIFDSDRYRPLKRGEDREKMKERLANTMAYGDDQEQQKQPPSIIKKPQPKLPTSKQIWNELVTQIRERSEWLAEMEYLGQAGPHRDIIKDQIAERMRALDALGIDDSECQTPKSAASGFTLRYKEPEPIGQRRNSSVPSSRPDKSEKKRSARSTVRARDKEENVSAYSQLSPLQYSPRRRQ